MSEIDFAVAFVMTLSIVSFSVISVSNKLSSDFNLFNEKKVEASSLYLSGQLFGLQDENSLVDKLGKIDASFQEVGLYPHTETFNITLSPRVGDIHVYDNTMREINSNVENTSTGTSVLFALSFLSGEKKYASLIFSGSDGDVSFTSPANITSTVVSGGSVYALSFQKCSDLRLQDYNYTKEKLGFSGNFKISVCDYGLSPPNANVIVKAVPILIQRQDGSIYSDIVRLSVW